MARPIIYRKIHVEAAVEFEQLSEDEKRKLAAEALALAEEARRRAKEARRKNPERIRDKERKRRALRRAAREWALRIARGLP